VGVRGRKGEGKGEGKGEAKKENKKAYIPCTEEHRLDKSLPRSKRA